MTNGPHINLRCRYACGQTQIRPVEAALVGRSLDFFCRVCSPVRRRQCARSARTDAFYEAARLLPSSGADRVGHSVASPPHLSSALSRPPRSSLSLQLRPRPKAPAPVPPGGLRQGTELVMALPPPLPALGASLDDLVWDDLVSTEDPDELYSDVRPACVVRSISPCPTTRAVPRGVTWRTTLAARAIRKRSS